MTENSAIVTRASDLAAQHSPGVVLRKFAIFLENLFFGVFRVLGWMIGRSWYHGAQVLFVIGLAFSDGYKLGAKIPPKEPQALPPGTYNSNGAPAVDLVDDDRVIDTYQTPFGVPYGPNVHASHD